MSARPPEQAPMWLQRISLVLLVAVCLYIGLLMAVLPWLRIWSDNPLLHALPVRWASWLQTGAVRGIVSGIGLLDIWIGLQEIAIWHSQRAHLAKFKDRR